jgi:hypothetical protein
LKIEYGSNFEIYKTEKIKESIKFHENAIYYGSGRYAISELIQHYVSLGDWKRIFVPDYYCMDVIYTISKTGINIVSYQDNPTVLEDQENISKMCFKNGDVLLRINFFGLRSFRSNDKIQIPVIEDHTHGLFSDWALSSDADWCFSSIRKSLPVADGGVLWSPTNNIINIKTKCTTKEHHELVKNRYSAMKVKSQYFLNKNPASKNKYLQLFKETEECFTNNPSSLISPETLTLLNKIPFNIDDSKRLNFEYLLPKLDQYYYKVLIPESDQTAFSLAIILESQSIRDDLRLYLIKNNIYPTILWKLNKNISSDESLLVSNTILSIHIDFRYNFYDLDNMCKILNSYNLCY